MIDDMNALENSSASDYGYYRIEYDAEGKHPLTGIKLRDTDKFTTEALEVYLVRSKEELCS